MIKEVHMKISDRVDITDSPMKGVVILKKEDGTVIFKKENMIVETGRKYLKELYIKSLAAVVSGATTETGADTYTREFDDYSVNYIGFGNNGSITRFEATGLSGTARYAKILQTDVFVNDPLSIRFVGVIDNATSDTGFSAQELGLFLTIGDDLDTKKLFSRVVFDPIPVGSGDRYEIEYYIYF
jgi:hypothetical protein